MDQSWLAGDSYLHADHRPSAAAVLALVHRLVAAAERVEAQDPAHAVPDQTHLQTRTTSSLGTSRSCAHSRYVTGNQSLTTH